MKIAWIDHMYHDGFDGNKDSLDEYLKEYNFNSKIDIERDLSSFIKKFGSLEKYRTLILHSGLRNQKDYLERIPKKHPELKIYFLSYSPEDYIEFKKREIRVMQVSYALPEIIKESELGELIEKLTKN
ncbi:MAG: hypothetical protein Q8Q04_02890 [archaeon]|nr:hypothetical protein [archaeon]